MRNILDGVSNHRRMCVCWTSALWRYSSLVTIPTALTPNLELLSTTIQLQERGHTPWQKRTFALLLRSVEGSQRGLPLNKCQQPYPQLRMLILNPIKGALAMKGRDVLGKKRRLPQNEKVYALDIRNHLGHLGQSSHPVGGGLHCTQKRR